MDLEALGIDIDEVKPEDLCKLVAGTEPSKRKKRQVANIENSNSTTNGNETHSNETQTAGTQASSASPPVDLYINPGKASVRKAFEEQTVNKYKELFGNIDLIKARQNKNL